VIRNNVFALVCVAALGSHAAAAADVAIAHPELAPPPLALQQQIQVLQQQMAQLQAQLGALLAAVQVTPTGVTLQGPNVTIAGNVVGIRAQSDLRLDSNASVTVRTATNVSIQAGANTSLTSGANFIARSSGGATLQSSGELDLAGATLRLNGGTKPLARVGSEVQGVASGTAVAGQIVGGSPSVLSN
jgi:hypothetical protein